MQALLDKVSPSARWRGVVGLNCSAGGGIIAGEAMRKTARIRNADGEEEDEPELAAG